MYLLYSAALALGFVVLLPRFLFDAARHGKYAAGFRHRLGLLPQFDAGGRPVVWLHCVSVGETQAARPLARALIERYPGHALVVSTTTLTGQRVAREVFADSALAVFYFPFDFAFSVRRALRHVSPALVLVMETELWPRFLRECRARRVPVALVNGRLSEKSFRRYKLIRPFIRRVVSDLSLAAMQAERDAARIRALGLPRERVFVAGNVKFDAPDDHGEQHLTEELRARFGVNAARPLVLAASTHAPEERLLLEAFRLLRAQAATRDARLLLAPRHPERFAEVAALIAASGCSWSRRSSVPDAARDAACDIILLDTVGELRAAYPLAEIVFVGGSLARRGGHSVIEPALHARCVVTGPHTFNFASVVRDFVARDALVQLPALADEEYAPKLAATLSTLLADDARRFETGRRARAVLEENRGAAARSVELLTELVSVSGAPHAGLESNHALESGAAQKFNA